MIFPYLLHAFRLHSKHGENENTYSEILLELLKFKEIDGDRFK